MIRLDVDRFDREAGIRGMTSAELATVAGVPPATLSRARAGRPLRAHTLARLARALTETPVIPGAELLLIAVPIKEEKAANEPATFSQGQRGTNTPTSAQA